MLGRRPRAATTSFIVLVAGEPNSIFVVTRFILVANSATARFKRVGDESRRLPNAKSDKNKLDDFLRKLLNENGFPLLKQTSECFNTYDGPGFNIIGHVPCISVCMPINATPYL
ncbi:hypothetical protein DERP_000749 [Dermatophagoides pteronyssinus]|uniref:Uncharacterized protein n=1 Tax=Dermatophagoides pteronyssinus TaxID=6956 RepID=A0ABQ8J1K8_DERPT|nr:hypothetical protein DERP_000749 [Dermatophagoides pteronyssinus]